MTVRSDGSFRAEPLEQRVLAALRLILIEIDDLSPKLRAIVLDQLGGAQRSDGDVEKLRAERARIERQMSFLLDDLDEVGRSTLKRKMTAMQARLKEIRDEMRRAESAQPTVADADLIVEKVCTRLGQFGEELRSLPIAAVRAVLQQFVSKLVVDLETRDVSVEFALPDWSVDALNRVCLDDDLAYKTDNRAQPILIVKRRIALWSRLPVGVYDFAA